MNTMLLLEAATWIAPFILAAGLVSIAVLRIPVTGELRPLVVYLAICLLADISSRIMAGLYDNNLVAIPVFGFLELAVMSYFYCRLMLRSVNVILVIALLAGFALIILETVYVLRVEPLVFHAYARVIDAFLIVVQSILYFKQMGEEEDISTGMLELNTVVLLFFSANLLFFLPVNFLINENSGMKFLFWIANLVLTICFYLFIIRTLWKSGKIHRQLRFGSR